jgi:hypothetical protein
MLWIWTAALLPLRIITLHLRFLTLYPLTRTPIRRKSEHCLGTFETEKSCLDLKRTDSLNLSPSQILHSVTPPLTFYASSSGLWVFTIPDSHFRSVFWTQGPPLWSSGQSSWLQNRRYRVRFPGTTKKSSGSGTGSSQPRDYNWGATWKK